MAKLISQSCGELQPAVCLSRDMQPLEGDPYTRGRLTSLRNKPQQKQPGQLSASIPGWIVSQCVQLLFDGEKCVLLLCAWKPAFLRSGHILIWSRSQSMCKQLSIIGGLSKFSILHEMNSWSSYISACIVTHYKAENFKTFELCGYVYSQQAFTFLFNNYLRIHVHI